MTTETPSAASDPGTLSLPVLPLKTTVLFPGIFTPLSVGRPRSLAALTAALATEEKMVLVVAQRDAAVQEPQAKDLYRVGTRAMVKRMTQSAGGYEILVIGIDRVAVEEFDQTEPHLQARVRVLPSPEDEGAEIEALRREVTERATEVLESLHPKARETLASLATASSDPIAVAYLVGSLLTLEVAKEQALLEADTRLAALRMTHDYLAHEIQVLELREKITSRAQTELTKEQREYMLRKQLRAIQQELGDASPEQSDVQALRKRFEEADLPEHVRKEGARELDRLERLPSAAPDHQITRSYLELILELPWRKSSEDTIDLKRARTVLDEDHHDLEEVKERILEHLAVMKLNPKAHAPILCFVGPPGVGKTSLGQSIARALGRKFERMSLGGLHDEAELRGHRRTYIGAMPGRLIQAIRRAGVNNPLLMLDEIDKLGRDYRGDPAAALLEILDPAQNDTFHDNFLDLPFDLSRALFITTANSLDPVPAPLLDRMEVLRLTGYTQEDKTQIARRYLIPRRVADAGLTPEQFQLPDATLARVISHYTREAGVRQLERAIGTLARKVALRIAEGGTATTVETPTEPAAGGTPAEIRVEQLPDLLGPERYLPEKARTRQVPGVATGLAWTETGGEVLYIEATVLPNGSGLTLTGSLGDVMQESAKAAQSWVWAHADELGIERAHFRESGVHVHVPSGAVPKDGPSAGVAMVTALASAHTHAAVAGNVAMTGEITLSGLVLPVGGIKEKVLAARRSGIRRVVLPRDNEKDLRELPAAARRDLEFVLVETIEEALRVTLPGVLLDGGSAGSGTGSIGTPVAAAPRLVSGAADAARA